MAGRGRGGGGRGRGRGMTFDAREMGFGPGEQLPAPVLQPPPLFPPLDHTPAPITTCAEMVYMVALKKDLTIFLKDHLAISDSGEIMKDMVSQIDWALLPDELKTLKRRKLEKGPRQIKKSFDINKLDELQSLEELVDDPEEEKEIKEEKEEGDEGNENNDEETEEDVDEEMDDGTDYVNNYFDNGEGFDDDDDAGNDGPVY